MRQKGYVLYIRSNTVWRVSVYLKVQSLSYGNG